MISFIVYLIDNPFKVVNKKSCIDIIITITVILVLVIWKKDVFL